ncbi:MAG: aminopeptidase P family protein [Gemmatimonadetes bacterium]|nr:aminopeptidase P family protein [Gemmatimonadota bacterium]
MAITLDRLNMDELRGMLKSLGLDGWLLYDFKGANPIARRVLGLGGLITRRVFVWLPATGVPVALVHRIEAHGFAEFPGTLRLYGSWRELEQELASLVRGRRVALETSPSGGVPYLDRVPAGTVHVLERIGAVLSGSAPLVSRFASAWSAAERRDHETAADAIATIARAAVADAVRAPGTATETSVQRGVTAAMHRAGLIVSDPPVVAFGANAANPHYEPRPDRDIVLAPHTVVLLDLWGRAKPDTVFADQTWMGFSGAAVPDDVERVWMAVRDARDTALERVRRWRAGSGLTGAMLDDAAREVVAARGFGEAFLHRTGHSIDGELHGSGPNLDNFETNDTREFVTGVGFSVEPGVYLPGRFGVRSEVNAYLADDGAHVTPREIQRELIRPD